MTRTTPPRPADIAVVLPRLAPLARTATRLHPRPGSPSPQESSVGGPLLWPSAEPWPHCEGTHRAPALLPATSPADVRLLREIRAAARNRPQGSRSYSPQEHAVVDRINAGRPCPEGPVALLAVAQLYVHEVPDLRPPEGADLLQVLWCAFDHPGENMPRTELFWRSAAAVGDVLTAPPQPPAIQYDDYLPEPCLVFPEQITEYPRAVELDPDLRAQVQAWSARQKTGAKPGSADYGAEDTYYDRELSVAPGWKAGGWAPWSFTDPAPQDCRVCGSRMEPMLTIATKERHVDMHSWTPYEDQAAVSMDTDYPDPARPTMITIGDGYNQQIYACPGAPNHPHTALMQ
ncbi:hypothetical protein [Kitasatospora atroaurantiaca]|uniref:DUF1963 domain-containing protein n=1 Tax=Kitasatospora atroaurantiaca TaxID=285545 RepID=A0A561EI68_9ACTN|nr:hypothetical protein [Kitasatospora atroaurantiaca]TWE15315.1 hypothetical protein FB465_0206 [Kitasatospora atroaurantiaca]